MGDLLDLNSGQGGSHNQNSGGGQDFMNIINNQRSDSTPTNNYNNQSYGSSNRRSQSQSNTQPLQPTHRARSPSDDYERPSRRITPPAQNPGQINATNSSSSSSHQPPPSHYSSGSVGEQNVETVGQKVSSTWWWGLDQLKITKHSMMEKMGKAPKTVDAELDSRLERLNEYKSRFKELRKTTTALAKNFELVTENQRQMSIQFRDLGLKSADLRGQFERNAGTFEFVVKNGETMLVGIKSFLSSLETLLDKTIADTMVSVKFYENCRLEYDTLKFDLDNSKSNSYNSTLAEKRSRMQKARDTLMVKLDLLNDNRQKVMKKHLTILNDATRAFYSGNELALQQAINDLSKGYDQY